MKRVTEETRDEVKDTKKGAAVGLALETCLDHGVSPSARVAACKPFLLEVPDSRIVDYLGLPVRLLNQDSAKVVIETAEVDLPNVVYVGEAKDIDYALKLAPTSADLYSVLRLAALQVTSDIGSKAMLPGVTGAEMEDYRRYARRLLFVGTAIFGAVHLKDLTRGLAPHRLELLSGAKSPLSFQVDTNRIASTLPKVLNEAERAEAAALLTQLAKSTSLTESEVQTLGNLNRMRLGIAN
jgi:hypothetical protein